MIFHFFKSKLIILFTMLLITVVGLTYYSKQFRAGNITFALPLKNSSTALLPDEILTQFDQPLRYLDEGNQAFAFTTNNGNFVVKFFKSDPLSARSWLEMFSGIPLIDSYLNKKKERSRRKFDRVFEAYDIAFSHDQENCGLVYTHLIQSDHLNLSTIAIDAFGVSHFIPLDQYAFVIQKKGEPLKKILKRELDAGNIDTIKQKLHCVIAMYLEEYQRGIFDHDHNLMSNVGFSEGRPMRIDVGKLVLDLSYQKKEVYLPDLKKIIHERIEKWLKRYSPSHSAEILLSLETYLQQ